MGVEILTEPVDEFSYKTMFHIWNGVFIMVNLFFFGRLMFIVYYEAKQNVRDKFKYLQGGSFMVSLALALTFRTLYLLNPDYPIVLKYIRWLGFICIFCFLLSNQTCWATLIIYMKKYRQLRNKKNKTSYGEIREKILSFEKGIKVPFVIIFGYYTGIILIGVVIQTINNCDLTNGQEKTNQNSQLFEEDNACKILSFISQYLIACVSILIFGCFAISEGVLYLSLTRLMRTDLHFFYTKKVKELRRLTCLNQTYFFGGIIYFFISIYSNVNLETIISQKRWGDLNYLQTIGLFALSIFANVPMYLCLYFNVKNINFKVYLWNLMTGYEIQGNYHEASSMLIVDKVIDSVENRPSLEISDEEAIDPWELAKIYENKSKHFPDENLSCSNYSFSS